MSELKISEAAISGAGTLCQNAFLNRNVLLNEYTCQEIIQLAINSEIDRIAGPLAEALAETLNSIQHGDCLAGECILCIGTKSLANYRKERGE